MGKDLLYSTTFQLVSIMQFYVCRYIGVYLISSPGKFKLDTVLHRSETFEMAM